MLDLIYSHMVYDGCSMFCTDASTLLLQFCQTGGGFASFAAAREDKLQTKLEDFIDLYAEIGG